MKPHDHEECCCSGGCSCHSHHDHHENHGLQVWLPVLITALLFGGGLIAEHLFAQTLPARILYALAYLPVGWPVWKHAWNGMRHGDWFNEFVLMALATVGAFCIGEFAEAVAVMLFYTIGEEFQERAVRQAQSHIDSLLDMKEQQVEVFRNGAWTHDLPEQIQVNETIRLQAGNQIPLDGILLSDKGRFNTAALTGESVPQSKHCGDALLAGMINEEHVIEMQVTHRYEDSARARILELVREARSRKSATELMIRRLARVYTPTVFVLALLIAVLPPLFLAEAQITDWIYRALIFLVISCPCALVISIPLAYFSGIGAASRQGILFKGASFMDRFPHLKAIVFDKTGTLTYGDFTVLEAHLEAGAPDNALSLACSLEQLSSHPVAHAITKYGKEQHLPLLPAEQVREVAGKGLTGIVDGHTLEMGNAHLLTAHHLPIPEEVAQRIETVIYLLIDGTYAGYFLIADRIKEDATRTIQQLKRAGIEQTVMLSGDKQQLAEKVGKEIGIDRIYGDLLPEDKVKHIERIKTETQDEMAYVGDGINDTPSLALSSIGIAMGKNGSEAAIETADVILQTDHPERIVTALRISQATRRIVWQNIILALGVKLAVLLLGAFGVANMWEAVFADVGVALLAVLNSIRLLRMRFDEWG